jgi:hypothetical protein
MPQEIGSLLKFYFEAGIMYTALKKEKRGGRGLG